MSFPVQCARRFLFVQAGVGLVLCVAAACCASASAQSLSLDYNRLAAGMDFKKCWIGPAPDAPQPQQKGKMPPRRWRAEQRLGGLGWEVDIADGAPHICGRAIPGFRHFEAFQQGAPPIQPFAAFDMGVIAPPGEELTAAVTPAGETGAAAWGARVLFWNHGGDGPASLAEYTTSLIVSRLTPAILVETWCPRLALFGGPQYNWRGGEVKSESRVPAFAAVRLENGVRIASGANPRDLPVSRLSDSWLLLWWGPLVTTSDSPDPSASFLDRDRTGFWGRTLERDAPVLVVFERSPLRIAGNSMCGGLLIESDDAVGKIALFPLFGDMYPDTAGWENGLPEEVVSRADWWARRLRLFPTAVNETYSWDPATDTVSVKACFEFTPVGAGGTAFAPLPPMLALAAKHGFPVEIEGAAVDPGYVTMAGPLLGVEAESCAYSIRGMGRYVDRRLVPGPATPQTAGLEAELASELNKVLNAGKPLAPALCLVNCGPGSGAIAPWSNPGDSFLYLAQAASLAGADQKRRILEYLAALGREFPPDKPGLLPYDRGVLRNTGEPPLPETAEAMRRQRKNSIYSKWETASATLLTLDTVPPENLYALAAYIEAGGEWDLKSRWDPLGMLKPYLSHADWPTMGWSRFDEAYVDGRWRRPTLSFGRGGVSDANRWFAGMIGLCRLAKICGDQETEAAGRYLFVKAAALRFALGKLTRYYYETGRIVSPSDPAWYRNAMGFPPAGQVRESAGYPFAADWRGPEDDIRQAVVMDEFGVTLRVTPGVYAGERLPIFDFMVPELACFLRDHLKPECEAYIRLFEEHAPDWDAAYADSSLGSEASFMVPENAYQIFLAKAFILEEKPEYLRERLDVPWTLIGDYYYISKLWAVICAGRGAAWR